MIPYVELKTQFSGIEQEIRAAIDTVLDSGWFILGEQVREFERAFATYLGESHALGVASGTDAIHLALRALGIGPGDEVITVPNTCVPTLCGIVASGATPVLTDVHPQTLTMDPESLRSAITDKTRAVVPVHLYGHPCDMDAIIDIACKHDLYVVEDCAQAHGSLYKDRQCGSFGDAAAFSFYPSKNLGAYGDGGAVVTSRDDVAEQIRMLRNYGEERRYHHSIEGVNSRLDEMQAAILRVKLRHLDEWNRARRDRAEVYRAALAGAGVDRIVEAEWAQSNYHLFVIQSAQRDALQEHLKQNDIGTFIHYPIPIHLQRAYERLGYKKGNFPVSEAACDRVLSLPMYPELPLDAVPKIARSIAAFTS